MKYLLSMLLLFQISFAEVVNDSDKDLIPDSVDLCPNTPQNVFVNKFGCRQAIQKVLYFDHSQSIIKPNGYLVIDEIIKLAKELEGYKIYIQGHADSTSSPEVNQIISKHRAYNVYRALSKELEKSRMVISWYGESQPTASNVSQEGRSQNRRVTIHLK